MRLVYWLSFAVQMLLVILSVAVFQSPEHGVIDSDTFDAWFLRQTAFSGIIGLALGIGAGQVILRRTHIQPTDSADQFSSRVILKSLLWCVGAIALSVALATVLAASNSGFEPASGSERVALIFNSAKILGVGAAAGALFQATFALLTRAKRWGGTYSLVN